MVLTLGHWSTDLQFRMAIVGAIKSWCAVTPIEEPPVKPPIDYVGKTDRYHVDGDGGMYDDFGTGLGGQPQKERRFCKGCLAEVTNGMYCFCGDFDLMKSETLSEKELEEMEKQFFLQHGNPINIL